MAGYGGLSGGGCVHGATSGEGWLCSMICSRVGRWGGWTVTLCLRDSNLFSTLPIDSVILVPQGKPFRSSVSDDERAVMWLGTYFVEQLGSEYSSHIFPRRSVLPQDHERMRPSGRICTPLIPPVLRIASSPPLLPGASQFGVSQSVQLVGRALGDSQT